MKKKITLSLLLALCLVLSLGGMALASSQITMPHVTDAVGLLSNEEIMALEQQAGQIEDSYGCAPYILVVEDFRVYEDTTDIFEAGMNLYERWELGHGPEKNGLLLILSMAERDYALVTYGSVTHRAFTDYGQDALCEQFLDNFRNDDWAGGFRDYLDGCAWLLEQAKNGTPYDVDTASKGFSPLILVIPLVLALAVCLVLTAQMKTAKRKTEAGDYMVQGGAEMRVVQDIFTHRTVTRQVIQSENKGGGGGTTINARGFSGKSGKF
ncbi:MAG: TPM domain-containing protein [Oscillospiraceae bacterium]|nr:TPM domain-containing protein [Oscillospiraceae bacterium]